MSLYQSLSFCFSLSVSQDPPHYLSFWQMSHKVFVSLHLSISISLVLSATWEFQCSVCVCNAKRQWKREWERESDRQTAREQEISSRGRCLTPCPSHFLCVPSDHTGRKCDRLSVTGEGWRRLTNEEGGRKKRMHKKSNCNMNVPIHQSKSQKVAER